MPSDPLTTIGKPLARQNGPEIVTGRMMYADDIHFPGMIYGRVLHSPHPHAQIRKIDVSGARALPGVVDVITAQETPGLSILASKEVCYQGDKVAVVVAEDPDIAEDALALIKVDYKILPSVADPVAAMAPNAPEVRLGASCEDVTDEGGPTL